MAGFSDDLKRQLPSLVLSILAGRTGGLPAVSAFQGGMAQRQQADQEQRRQAALDAERRQQQAAIEARSQRDDTRMDDAAQMQRLQAALSTLDRYSAGVGETASDPVAAENAILGRGAGLETAFGLPQGQLSPFVPNMAPAISSRKKRQAQELYAQAEKLYGAEAMAGDSVTLQTELFGDVKPSQLRALFGPQAVTSTGAPAVPMVSKPDVPNTPEEQFYQTFAEEHGTTWTKLSRAQKAAARKEWMQADDRQPVGSDPEIVALRKDLLQSQVDRAGEAKEPNQAQFTASAYAGRMAQAEPILTAVTPVIVGMGLPAYELQTNSWFAKPTFQSKEVQSYMQAARNFINAVLRRESGAVISPSEFAEARQQYLPQPNDTPEALANKKANREYVFSTMKRASGSAYEPPMAPIPPLTKDSVPGGIYLHNGKKVKVREKTRTGFLFDEVAE